MTEEKLLEFTNHLLDTPGGEEVVRQILFINSGDSKLYYIDSDGVRIGPLDEPIAMAQEIKRLLKIKDAAKALIEWGRETDAMICAHPLQDAYNEALAEYENPK